MQSNHFFIKCTNGNSISKKSRNVFSKGRDNVCYGKIKRKIHKITSKTRSTRTTKAQLKLLKIQNTPPTPSIYTVTTKIGFPIKF